MTKLKGLSLHAGAGPFLSLIVTPRGMTEARFRRCLMTRGRVTNAAP
jgi:hypothetical protein